MPHIHERDEEETSGEATCLHCGGDAAWHFLDEAQSKVEIMCPDCGRYEISRAEFDCREIEVVEPEG